MVHRIIKHSVFLTREGFNLYNNLVCMRLIKFSLIFMIQGHDLQMLYE